MSAGNPRTLTDDERSAWFGLLTVHSLVTRELDTVLSAAHDLALVEYDVLQRLSSAGGRLRMSALADASLLSRSGLTRIVGVLEAHGLVAREADPDDGRVLIATLTPSGRRRLASARRTHVAHVRRLFLDRLSARQQSALGGSWSAVLAGFEPDARRRPQRRRARIAE